MLDVQGKKILYVGSKFFGYELEITNALRQAGAEVDFVSDSPTTSKLMRGVMRVRRELVLPLADRYVFKMVEAFARSHYDVVFVVTGEVLTPRTLAWLRARYPAAQFVLYLWDALRNKRLLEHNLPFFDRCLSFDATDAKRYGMVFRPLFYSPGFAQNTAHATQYHLSFIGTAHSDRARIVQNVEAALPPNTKFFKYLYLQAPWVYWVHKLGNAAYKGVAQDAFTFEPMPKAQVQKVFFSSLAVLDIEHPGQTGLTMRTCETIGAQKKLITTNAMVKATNFYRPENILVIDRHSAPQIPDAFFSTPYQALPQALYETYSLQGWLNDVLGSPKVQVG